MNDLTQAPTTITNIGVVMFTVADQDAALAFYTEKLGFEVRPERHRRHRPRPRADAHARRPVDVHARDPDANHVVVVEERPAA